MFTPEQYREKAVEYGNLVGTATTSNERREFQQLQMSFAKLADNEQWLAQWNTLPTKLQRELFDNAGSMGELLDTPALRGQIARFLHRYKDDEGTAAT